MVDRVADSREFIRGAARYRDLVYILSKGKALMKEDIAHTSLLGIYQGKWGDNTRTAWNSTALAVAKKPSERLVFIGEDGEVCTYVGGKTTKEAIKPAPKMIRHARTVDGHVFACGMARQVYKRVGERKWENISAPKPEPGEEVGFEAIDGYSEKELYAAGWNGEIWEMKDGKWIKHQSQGKAILTAVCCAGDGFVYAAGQGGIFFKGRHDQWEAMKLKNVDDDLWDLCWFNNKLYVSTMTGLFTLE